MNTDKMRSNDNDVIVTENVQLDSVENGNKYEIGKVPAKKRLKPIHEIIVSIVLFILGSFLFYILNILKNNRNDVPEIEAIPTMVINNPDHWESQVLFNAFSIKVPVTVEKRTKGCPYESFMDSIGFPLQDDVVVFAQKGLNDRDSMAVGNYCRIMFKYYEGDYGNFLMREETVELNSEDDQAIDEMVKNELGYASLIGTVDRKWVHINNANAIMVSYRRTGANPNPYALVRCKILLFQDDNRIVKMILAYRERETDLWADDFEQVLRSFKWID